MAKRFPHKTIRPVRGSLHPKDVDGFLKYMSLQFQPGQAADLDATYHFRFTGSSTREATIIIRDQKLTVLDGHQGKSQLSIVADADTWIGFLRREKTLAWALLTLRIRLWGSPTWLLKFGKCFPS